jgi:phospholipid-binding lipoprotein MlaA
MTHTSFFKAAIILSSLLSVTACASRRPYGEEIAPARRYSDIQARETGNRQFAVYDPGEGLNKHIYKFNAKLDDYVLVPIVDGYKAVTPEFVRNRVTNFFMNVGEIPNFTNSVLQGSPRKTSITVGRFAINTTVGLLGTFDVATKMGLDRQQEDFGQTLGTWGAGPGAYVVLPVLGPSNIRDATGKAVDLLTLAFLIPNKVEDDTAYKVVVFGLAPVNSRYNNNFRYYQSGSPFEYELVRYVTTQARKLQIEK